MNTSLHFLCVLFYPIFLSLSQSHWSGGSLHFLLVKQLQVLWFGTTKKYLLSWTVVSCEVNHRTVEINWFFRSKNPHGLRLLSEWIFWFAHLIQCRSVAYGPRDSCNCDYISAFWCGSRDVERDEDRSVALQGLSFCTNSQSIGTQYYELIVRTRKDKIIYACLFVR